MRAPQASRPALILSALIWSPPALADDPPTPSRKPAATAPRKVATPSRNVEAPAPKAEPSPPKAEAPNQAPLPITPATHADVNREVNGTKARITELSAPEMKDKSGNKAIVELLQERLRLLDEWVATTKKRAGSEHPEPSPERQAAESKADLEKSRAVLDQAAKAPDSLLPESFLSTAPPAGATAARPEARLGELKDALDGARNDLKDRTTELESLRAEGTNSLTAQVAKDRGERDKVHQKFVALTATRGEREAAVASANSTEARELARDRLTNFEWEARLEAERIAEIEARITLAGKRLELVAVQAQARAARVQLARKVLERMEDRYSAIAERQRTELKREVAKEETRAAQSDDPIVRRKAKRTAELLELESQVVAYEKAYATSGGVSLQEQAALADATEAGYAQLKKMIDDGNVSPLDALRLKNDFRRITEERSQVVRTDLAASESEMVGYENALTDAEIDLVNDSRDDRYDRETLLEQMPERRRAEASAMLDELETKHRALLNRRRNVLQKLASRAEDAHNQVARRIDILDQQYAFIRTHIFWVRDAEPIGVATVAHARDESIRTARALARLAIEPADPKLWGPASAEFIVASLALVALPWPLLWGRKTLDRLRLGAGVPETAPGLGDFEARVMGDG